MNTHSILVMLFYSTDILLSTLLFLLYLYYSVQSAVLFLQIQIHKIPYCTFAGAKWESGLWPERHTLTDGRKTTRKTVLCTRIFGCFALVWQWYRIVLCKSAPYP